MLYIYRKPDPKATLSEICENFDSLREWVVEWLGYWQAVTAVEEPVKMSNQLFIPTTLFNSQQVYSCMRFGC